VNQAMMGRFTGGNSMKNSRWFVLLMMVLTMVGCGSPVSNNAATGGGTVGASVMTMTLSTATLLAGGTATVTATLVDGAGAPVANAAVVFSSTHAADTFSAATATTNALGIASTIITAGSVGGTATLTAASGAASAVATYTVNVGTLTLGLTNPATGAAVSNITIGSPIKVSATVVDGAGAAVVGAVVTFSTNAAIGVLIPASATALTDAAGVAFVNMDGVVAGAATVTATAQLGVSVLTGSSAYSVGAAVLTMPNPMVFGVNPLSANGTTTVSVNVFSGGALVTAPVAVSFSSVCSIAGTATISSPVTTVAGTATATYTDKGCGTTDSITASVAGATLVGALTVTPPAVGSIQFVSAVPVQVALKGTGGAETSIVTFKVLDGASNPLAGKVVTFSLSTTVGGVTLSQPTGITDVLGLVTAVVSSGTVSTPVRVIATTPGAAVTLQTLSDVLTITTGIPDQDSASLSATILNIEGWNIDGTQTVLTMRLSDHFNNPVPDGTAVNFTTEGGQIVGTCATVAGACSSTLSSSNPRPADGRVTVLAYAVGEESFIDLNGNGLADNAAEMVDINANPTDLNEAFVDYDESTLASLHAARIPNGIEPFIDFNVDGLFTLADAKYSGVLCNPATGIFCAASPNVHVRDSIVVVFSSSGAVITPPLATLDLGGTNVASACNVPTTATFRITDIHGNAMPAGSTISFATSNGTLTGTTSFVVPNTSANVVTSPAAFNYTVGIKSDAAFTAAVAGPPAVAAFCTDTTPSGTLTVSVTTPLGTVTTGSIAVNN